MDDIKRDFLSDHEAEKKLEETGFFKAGGDLALDSCPFCGSSEVVYEKYLRGTR